MMAQITDPMFTESYEYHGSTFIAHVRRQNGGGIVRDWIIFDSVEAAEDFFNTQCSEAAESIH